MHMHRRSVLLLSALVMSAAAVVAAPLANALPAANASNSGIKPPVLKGPLTVRTGSSVVHVLGTPQRMAALRHRTSTSPSIKNAGVWSYSYSYGSPPLSYDGGPIMQKPAVYLIAWNPGKLQDGTTTSFDSAYLPTIQRFFKDVGGSGLYANNTQYYNTNSAGKKIYIQNALTYKATYTDAAPFPKNQCSTSTTGGNCITQANIQSEVRKVQKAHMVPAGLSVEFFLYTPSGEGSCFGAGACPDRDASYTDYCAYHSYGTSAYGQYPVLVYSNMPYPTPYCVDPADGQTFPNDTLGQAADAAVSLTSHELMESITDPEINAWLDASGYEIGDECAWQFPDIWTLLTHTGDVLMNGHLYSVQPEADLHANGCVFAGP